jgi:glycosyltransferase involved in cell wall biosynthesis
MSASESRISAVVIAHDARATGGVNNFLRIMRVRYRSRVAAVRFSNGRRQREIGKSQAVCRLVHDYVRFAGLLFRRRFDILHINPSLDHKSTPRELLFAWIASWIRPSTKILVFYRGWDWTAIETLRRSRVKRRLFLSAHSRIDRVMVLSSAFKDALVALGVQEDRIFTGTTMFEGAALDGHIDNTPEDRRTILFLCRFLPAKGGVPLLRAFARLRGQFPDWKLIMAGDGPQRAELETLTDNLELRDLVTFTGYVGGQRKMQLLVDAAIFVLPTTHPEGMPNAILEAMAAGQVILTTSVGGISDIVEDGVCGSILEVPNIDSIEKALRRYMNDPALIAAVAAHNRQLAWKNWESDIVSRRIADHYEDLVRVTD